MWFVLVNILCKFEKNVYSVIVWIILCISKNSWQVNKSSLRLSGITCLSKFGIVASPFDFSSVMCVRVVFLYLLFCKERSDDFQVILHVGVETGSPPWERFCKLFKSLQIQLRKHA
jgi:hypothetical protein